MLEVGPRITKWPIIPTMEIRQITLKPLTMELQYPGSQLFDCG